MEADHNGRLEELDDDKLGLSQSQIEDDSDLIYEKEVKVLLKDHFTVARFLMTFAIIVLALQSIFGCWCLYTIYEKIKSKDEGLLIIWYHILKLFHNLYIIKNFITRMKSK